jgi:hypothetical protein
MCHGRNQLNNAVLLVCLVWSLQMMPPEVAVVRLLRWASFAESMNCYGPLQLTTPVLLCCVLLQMMPPEVAVVRLLRWASDRKAACQLAMQHAELAGQLLAIHNQCVRCWIC